MFNQYATQSIAAQRQADLLASAGAARQARRLRPRPLIGWRRPVPVLRPAHLPALRAEPQAQ
jgi:hypothetical protein